jgi:hypothetical protein
MMHKSEIYCSKCHENTHHLYENGYWYCIECSSRFLNSKEDDKVNHPSHYTSHPSGIECIDIVEHMNYNLGNVVKYVWRADLKGNDLEDLKKAKFYIKREIERRVRNGKKD